MKKITFLLLMLIGLVASSQQIVTVYDTLNGAETVNFAFTNTGNYQSCSIDVLCTELGGTSDGTLILQAANDTGRYSTLSSSDFSSSIEYLTNDTLTVADAAIWKIKIINPAFRYYRIQGAGTSGDTTLVNLKIYFRNN